MYLYRQISKQEPAYSVGGTLEDRNSDDRYPVISVVEWVLASLQYCPNIPVFLLSWLIVLYYVARSNYAAKIQVQDQCQIILRPLYNFPLNIKIFSTYKMFRFVVPVYCLMFILSIKLV